MQGAKTSSIDEGQNIKQREESSVKCEIKSETSVREVLSVKESDRLVGPQFKKKRYFVKELHKEQKPPKKPKLRCGCLICIAFIIAFKGLRKFLLGMRTDMSKMDFLNPAFSTKLI
ncbi:uncharacterized protein LOC106661710 [Cimex lectularius]|uniref:Uncharacterized protein n=1 Tax=Cimex lectularius TaxID=79782 RepID=A0A8I6R7S0_CIMLE|nr:uncharacterized protein LOC106661710 [Cimex lectularius]